MCVAIYCSGQKIEHFIVRDIHGSEVPNAEITVLNTKGEICIKNMSDRYGRFELDLSVYQKCYLRINAMNFKEYFVQLNPRHDTVIVLQDTVNVIKAVEIRRKQVVIQKGDTTFFPVDSSLNAFTTLSDLLQDLPGIEVTKTGKVLFRGRTVSKILIDGVDLFGTNYTTALKNIKARVLSGVQAIDKFQEIELLRDFISSKDVALNLETKDTMKEAAHEFEIRYLSGSKLGGNYNRLDIGKYKALSVFGLNEFGSFLTENSATSNIQSNSHRFSMNGFFPIQNDLNTNINVFKTGDKEHNFSHNAVFNIKPKLALTSILNYNFEQRSRLEQSNLTYLLLDTLNFKETRADNRRHSLKSVDLKLESKQKSNFYMLNELFFSDSKLNVARHIDRVYLDSRANLIRSPLLIALNSKSLWRLQQNSLLGLNLGLSTEFLDDFRTVVDGVDSNFIKSTKENVHALISYLVKDNKFTHEWSLFLGKQKGSSGTLDVNSNQLLSTFQFSYLPKFRLSFWDISAQFDLLYLNKQVDLDMQPSADDLFRPNLIINLTAIPNASTRFTLSVNSKSEEYNELQLFPTIIPIDDQTFYKGWNKTGSNRNFQLLVNYIYTNLYNQFTFNISAYKSTRIRSLASVFEPIGNAVLWTLRPARPLTDGHFSFNLIKYMEPLKGSINWTTNLSYISYYNGVNAIKYNSLVNSLVYKTANLGDFNFRSRIAYQTINAGEMRKQRNLEIDLVTSVSLLSDLSLNLNSSMFRQFTLENKNYIDVSANLDWNMNNKTVVSVSARNLLNNNSLIHTHQDGIQLKQLETRVGPRLYLFKLLYQF